MSSSCTTIAYSSLAMVRINSIIQFSVKTQQYTPLHMLLSKCWMRYKAKSLLKSCEISHLPASRTGQSWIWDARRETTRYEDRVLVEDKEFLIDSWSDRECNASTSHR
jgi:hypothetical protein